MINSEEIGYAAIITVELPGMERPATVTLTLKPPDAVEVAPGQVKALRDCTLADLQAFADALEAELWERYRALTLTQLAATDQARLKITILGEAEEPLSAAQEQWLEQATAAEDGGGETTGGEREGAAQSAAQEAGAAAGPGAEAESETPDESPSETPDEFPSDTPDESPDTDEDESAAPAAEAKAADQETAVEEAAQQAAQEAAQQAGQEADGADADGAAATADAPAEAEAPPEAPTAGPAAAPVETPVVEGAEPSPAPVAAPPAEGGVRVAGLRRPKGHPTPAAVDILINEPAFREAQEHALSSLDREVAGMLVGPQPEKQPDGRYVVHITDVIAAKHTRMSGASVTYTPESWRYVTDVLEEGYPDGEAIIVGWYHTHPGFGIFLSGMDLFIHQNFFTQTWHVALVLDPRAGRSGFFCWNRQQTAVQPYEFPWPRWAAGSW